MLLSAGYIKNAIEALEAENRGPAAFICESILGCGGQMVLPDQYLKESLRLVREAGGVCIVDEVQVGFGRVGSHFWAFETQNVVPDIVILGNLELKLMKIIHQIKRFWFFPITFYRYF